MKHASTILAIALLSLPSRRSPTRGFSIGLGAPPVTSDAIKRRRVQRPASRLEEVGTGATLVIGYGITPSFAVPHRGERSDARNVRRRRRGRVRESDEGRTRGAAAAAHPTADAGSRSVEKTFDYRRGPGAVIGAGLLLPGRAPAPTRRARRLHQLGEDESGGRPPRRGDGERRNLDREGRPRREVSARTRMVVLRRRGARGDGRAIAEPGRARRRERLSSEPRDRD